MKPDLSRRSFLSSAMMTGTCLSAGGLSWLTQLRPVSAAEARLDPSWVRLNDDVEPLVRFLEETPRNRLLEETAGRIRRGLSYRQLLAALLLAGVRNIQPRPVGFKFHAVLVVNSAHLASMASPDSERWLPLFWALDYFKSSQARDVREGDWRMAPVEESKVPPSHRARQAFVEAMERWDEAAADVAAAALARGVGAGEAFNLFARFGARDFRDIGHKAIYVANSFRTLQVIGWHHAEPVLRSLAYALLERGRQNPAEFDLPEDRPGRRNWEMQSELPEGWGGGRARPEAARDLLAAFRTGSALDLSGHVRQLLTDGVSPQSVWDGVFDGAGELLMREPGIRSLHSLTTANALHHMWQFAEDDAIRRFALLQAASFVPLFRGQSNASALQIDTLEEAVESKEGTEGVEEIFDAIGSDRHRAARLALSWLERAESPRAFLDAARLMIFFKGRDSHDYKLSSAVLEDYAHVSPPWRNRYLAASVFYWRGTGDADNELVQRTRAALA